MPSLLTSKTSVLSAMGMGATSCNTKHIIILKSNLASIQGQNTFINSTYSQRSINNGRESRGLRNYLDQLESMVWFKTLFSYVSCY